MGGLGGGDERPERRQQRTEGVREAPAVEVLAHVHPAAVQPVLAAAGLHGGGERLACLCVVGGHDDLKPEQAAVLGALGVSHLSAVERRPQPALGQAPALLADEPVLVAPIELARELLEERRGGGELKAHDRRGLQADLCAGDLLQRRGSQRLVRGDERVDEAALLAEAHHVSGHPQAARARDGRLGVTAAEAHVGVGGADRGVERPGRGGLAAHVDRPLRTAIAVSADQLERHERLAVARSISREGMDDVCDRFDHVLEVLLLGLVMGGEVKRVERILATAAMPDPPYHEHNEHAADDQHAERDLGGDHQHELESMQVQWPGSVPARGRRRWTPAMPCWTRRPLVPAGRALPSLVRLRRRAPAVLARSRMRW